MQKINLTRSFLALSAASFALLPLIGAVQAKPKDDAPAYGYRNKNKNGRKNARNRNRGENFGRIVTLEGVVTSRDVSNEFEVRAGGQTFDVTSNSNVTVRQGDRVVLRGSFDGDNNFNAENVRVLARSGGYGGYGNNTDDDYDNGSDYGNNGGYDGGGTNDNNDTDYENGGGYSNVDRFQNGQRVSFPATFVRYVKLGQYEVRSDSGRTFRVEARGDFRLRRNGDRVQVTGTYRDSRIINARFTSTNGDYSNGGSTNGGNTGAERTVDFPGRIISINSRDKSAVVRGDNGRTYRVVGSELKGFDRGDRVRVRGVARNGTIDLRDLNRI